MLDALVERMVLAHVLQPGQPDLLALLRIPEVVLDLRDAVVEIAIPGAMFAPLEQPVDSRRMRAEKESAWPA